MRHDNMRTHTRHTIKPPSTETRPSNENSEHLSLDVFFPPSPAFTKNVYRTGLYISKRQTIPYTPGARNGSRDKNVVDVFACFAADV